MSNTFHFRCFVPRDEWRPWGREGKGERGEEKLGDGKFVEVPPHPKASL
jgi:hypothetical protein